ncbi:hypothetical protein [Streptomyces drozdowiczii]
MEKTNDEDLHAHGPETQADPDCKSCGGSGWIGDIVCPACS